MQAGRLAKLSGAVAVSTDRSLVAECSPRISDLRPGDLNLAQRDRQLGRSDVLVALRLVGGLLRHSVSTEKALLTEVGALALSQNRARSLDVGLGLSHRHLRCERCGLRPPDPRFLLSRIQAGKNVALRDRIPVVDGQFVERPCQKLYPTDAPRKSRSLYRFLVPPPK